MLYSINSSYSRTQTMQDMGFLNIANPSINNQTIKQDISRHSCCPFQDLYF